MIPGCQPCSRKRSTNQRTSGVLPLPPTVRLPTTITGTRRRNELSTPRRYKALRNALIRKNNQASGKRGNSANENRSLYHNRGNRCAITENPIPLPDQL